MANNERYVVVMMQAIESIIQEKGFGDQRHNIAETLIGMRKTCPDCLQLIDEEWEEICTKNNLTFSWEELTSTDK